MLQTLYRSIQIDYRQRDSFWEELISDYRYRIALPEELISITETDLWEFQQKSLVTDIQILSGIPIHFPLQIQISGSKRINSVSISATTVFKASKAPFLALRVATLKIAAIAICKFGCVQSKKQDDREGGLSLSGGSHRDRNRQNRHGCLFVVHFL